MIRDSEPTTTKPRRMESGANVKDKERWEIGGERERGADRGGENRRGLGGSVSMKESRAERGEGVRGVSPLRSRLNERMSMMGREEGGKKKRRGAGIGVGKNKEEGESESEGESEEEEEEGGKARKKERLLGQKKMGDKKRNNNAISSFRNKTTPSSSSSPSPTTTPSPTSPPGSSPSLTPSPTLSASSTSSAPVFPESLLSISTEQEDDLVLSPSFSPSSLPTPSSFPASPQGRRKNE